MYVLTGKILLDPTNHFILMTIKRMDSTRKTNMHAQRRCKLYEFRLKNR